MPEAGDIVIAKVQFTDTAEIKTRPALILFEEYGNVVVAGITSNVKMKGIPITVSEGAVKDSVIKLNYLFTISEEMVYKTVFRLSREKRDLVFSELMRKLGNLKG
jgi:mRNA interferase MazF